MDYLFLLLLPVVFAAGVMAVRRVGQPDKDRQRRTYRLSFPVELDVESVTAWIRSISGTLRSNNTRFSSVPTIVFETWATSRGIMHRIKVPWTHADYVIGQLQGLVPGVRITPEEEFPRRNWVRGVEVGLSHSSRQLAIYSHAVTSTSLLKSLEALEADEAIIMQWVVSPATPKHPPVYREAQSHHVGLSTVMKSGMANRDEINDRRHKLDEPNVMAVLRVASVAGTNSRAKHLIHRVRSSLSSTRTAAVRFQKRVLLTRDELQSRIDNGSTPLFFPMQLAAPELAAMLAWPLGNPNILGLPAPVSRQFPPADTVPREGLVVGYSSFPGSERPIAISYEQALMHTHVLGKTGVGKSVLLAHLARQAMDRGFGVILMETEGNLYQSVLDYVPAHRINDVVLLDVQDRQNPVGFNVLDQGNPLSVIDQIMDLFIHKFGKDGMGIWAQEYIYHGLRTISETPSLSFTDLVTLLNPRTAEEIDWIDHITRGLIDPELRRWWQRHDNRDRKQQQQRADPVLSRIWQLASRPELRFIMGQSKSTFKIGDLMRDNGILLVNLKGVSRDTAGLAGTLLMNAIWQAVKTVPKAKPTYIILDEFADFMDLPIDTESMLAQARKHNVGMILANQHMAQLKPSVREAIISNARSKVVFQTNSDDGRLVGREFGKHIEVEDFTRLMTFEAIAAIQTMNGTSSPISIRTLPPERKAGNAGAVINRSRKTYGRPLAEVKREIEERHRVKPDTERSVKRPTIGGGEPWG